MGRTAAEGAGPGRARAEGAGLASGGGLHARLGVRGTREDVEEVEPREASMGRPGLAGCMQKGRGSYLREAAYLT